MLHALTDIVILHKLLLTVALTVGKFVSKSFLKKIVLLGLVFLSGTLVAPVQSVCLTQNGCGLQLQD